jgi:hypothetical protein
MNLITINPLSKPNDFLEWVKAIASILAALISLTILYYTNKQFKEKEENETKRLRINKDIELAKQKHNLIFVKKLDVLSKLYEKLIKAESSIYHGGFVLLREFNNENSEDIEKFLNSIKTPQGEIDNIKKLWDEGDKDFANKQIQKIHSNYIEHAKQQCLIEFKNFFFLNEILINQDEISKKMEQLDDKLRSIIAFYLVPITEFLPEERGTENKDRDKVRKEAKDLISELKVLLKNELKI